MAISFTRFASAEARMLKVNNSPSAIATRISATRFIVRLFLLQTAEFLVDFERSPPARAAEFIRATIATESFGAPCNTLMSRAAFPFAPRQTTPVACHLMPRDIV